MDRGRFPPARPWGRPSTGRSSRSSARSRPRRPASARSAARWYWPKPAAPPGSAPRQHRPRPPKQQHDRQEPRPCPACRTARTQPKASDGAKGELPLGTDVPDVRPITDAQPHRHNRQVGRFLQHKAPLYRRRPRLPRERQQGPRVGQRLLRHRHHDQKAHDDGDAKGQQSTRKGRGPEAELGARGNEADHAAACPCASPVIATPECLRRPLPGWSRASDRWPWFSTHSRVRQSQTARPGPG